MIPRFANITELQVYLLWELMQGGERREVAEAYLNSAEFHELCSAHGRPDIPPSMTDKTVARLAGLFHAIHEKWKRSQT